MPVRLAGHRDVLPTDAVGSLNGFVEAGLGVRPPAPGQEVGLGRLLRPPCSGFRDYLLLVSLCYRGTRLTAQQETHLRC